jgi:hypothetical protein
MATRSISYFDANSYQIRCEDLEEIHILTKENNAVLKLLLDWICESNDCLEKKEERDRIMPVLFLVFRSTEKIGHLLPSL